MPRIPDALSEHLFFPEYEQLMSRDGHDRAPPSKFPVTDMEYTLAYAFLVVTMIVQLIAVLVFFARVYTRACPAWRFTIDDYLISVAFALMTVMFGLQYESVMWAWGGTKPAFRTIDEAIHGAMTGSLSLPFWAWSTGIVKISIACMLLRFQQSRGWRIFLYVLIALNVILIGFMGVATLFQCIPYKALWDFKGEVKNKKCWGRQMDMITTYISAACNIGTDIAFSLIPLTFLRKIRRPLREKMVIGGLMALGLVASAFALSKAIVTACGDKNQDIGAFIVLFGLLNCLEVQTSLIAACIPTLRSSSIRLLARMGLAYSSPNSADRRYGAGSSISGGPKGARRRVMQLNNISSKEIEEHPENETVDSEGADQYHVDSVTGRITHTNDLEGCSSRSNLNDEWRKNPESIIEEEWAAQRTIGEAR